MTNTHDPYLNTARRTLNEERIKLRKEKLQNRRAQKRGFLSQNVILSNYIYLPEGFKNLFLFILFISIPYLVGTLVILGLLMLDAFKFNNNFSLDSFMLTWTIGYESIAIMLLILITKNAFTFR